VRLNVLIKYTRTHNVYIHTRNVYLQSYICVELGLCVISILNFSHSYVSNVFRLFKKFPKKLEIKFWHICDSFRNSWRQLFALLVR